MRIQEVIRPKCKTSDCFAEVSLASPAFNADGSPRYRRHCIACCFASKRPWIKFKKTHCERCLFNPEDPCQLDVDHIDGNNKNNDPSNYQTLCANCHRLKTKRSKDYLARYKEAA